MADVLQERKTSITGLPENLLLEIFSYLTVRDVCRIGRVSRQWRRIARDNRLWRHVHLLPYKLKLQKTWKLIRAHFSDVLLSLRLRGYLDPAGISWKNATLSDAMLRDLLERCPNMVILELTQANITNVAIDNLPSGLTTLIITHSLVTPGWFQALTTKYSLLSELCHVDLSHSTKTSNADIKHLCSRPTITTLKLNGCYRITDEGFQAIAEQLKNLEVLCIRETECTDLAIHHISRNLKGLQHLDLTQCGRITDGAIGSIASSLHKLRWLSIAGCDKVTEDGIKQFSNLKLLETLKKTGDPVAIKDACQCHK